MKHLHLPMVDQRWRGFNTNTPRDALMNVFKICYHNKRITTCLECHTIKTLVTQRAQQLSSLLENVFGNPWSLTPTHSSFSKRQIPLYLYNEGFIVCYHRLCIRLPMRGWCQCSTRWERSRCPRIRCCLRRTWCWNPSCRSILRWRWFIWQGRRKVRKERQVRQQQQVRQIRKEWQ